MIKRDKAVFTIVRNERLFLPLWLKHYSQHFDAADIYVLDDFSKDGSTQNLNVNVINVESDTGAFDHVKLKDTVIKHQSELLEKYKCVFFAESDELIHHKLGLDYVAQSLLADQTKHWYRVEAYQYMHNPQVEPVLDLLKPIHTQRNYGFLHTVMCKPLISKIPLQYGCGFHAHTGDCSVDGVGTNTISGLYMLHIKMIDFELYRQRQIERIENEVICPFDNPLQAAYNKTVEEESILATFLENAQHMRVLPTEVLDGFTL